MSKYTPGPWGIAPPLFNGDTIFAPARAEVVAVGVLNHADARLIAAAPEMYEAIKGLIGEDSRIDTAEALLDAFLELKILIARIDGGSDE